MSVIVLQDPPPDVLTEQSPPGRRHPRRWPTVAAVAGVCAVALAVRLYRIGALSMWLDEAVSVWYADHGLVALWSWNHPLDPYHPPGYYSLLAIWTLGGHSEAWVRSFSALASVAALPFAFAATRRIAGRTAGLIAVALLAVSPLQVRFAQETRTYALMVFEAAVILWALTWLLRYPRIASTPLKKNPAALRWYAYVGAMSMALLSHNTGPLMWVTVNLAVFVHWLLTPHRPTAFLWSWTRANLAVGAVWLVWFPVFVRQSTQTFEGTGHRKVPTFDELVQAFRDLSLGQTGPEHNWILLGDGLAAATIVAALFFLARRPAVRRWAVTLAICTLTAPTVAYVVSVVGKPVFLTQSLMWVMVPFVMLVGVLAVQLPRVLTLAVVAGALTVSVIGLTAYYPSAHKEPWRDAAAYLAPRLGPGDLVVYSADYVMVPMQFYLHEPPGVNQIGTLYQPPDIATVRRELPDATEVWLVYAHWEFGDPNRWVEKVLNERGQQVEQMRFEDDIVLMRFLPRPPPGTGAP
jgi:mannosyltransferase